MDHLVQAYYYGHRPDRNSSTPGVLFVDWVRSAISNYSAVNLRGLRNPGRGFNSIEDVLLTEDRNGIEPPSRSFTNLTSRGQVRPIRKVLDKFICR